MKNWTIRRRITVGFATVILAVAAFGILSAFEIKKLSESVSDLTRDAVPGTVGVLKLHDAVTESAQYTATCLLPSLKESSKHHLEKAHTHIADLTKAYESTVEDEADRKLFQAFQAKLAPYLKASAEVVNLVEAGKSAEASAAFEAMSASTLPQVEDALEQLANYNETILRDTTGSLQGRLTTVNRSSLFGMILATVLAISIAFVIVRAINRALHHVNEGLEEGASQVASASTQVASASQILADGASEQAASLEETGASLEELTSMVKRNADNAQRAKQLASETRSAADAGSTDMQEMQKAMSDIKGSSDQVAKIVRHIDEIAFQTNILALNAAVEAARAGEAGAGFSVVADEVRTLAQRSAAAAKETADNIEAAIENSQRGVQISERLGEALVQIVAKVREVDQLVAEIAAASSEQAQGITQINNAVTQMDKVTQGNAASAEESASAAHELSAQAACVKDLVAELEALVGAAKSAAPSRSPKASHQGNASTKAASHDARETSPALSAPSRQNRVVVGTSHATSGSGTDKKSDAGFEAGFHDF